jgi:hypothetical protein
MWLCCTPPAAGERRSRHPRKPLLDPSGGRPYVPIWAGEDNGFGSRGLQAQRWFLERRMSHAVTKYEMPTS